MKKIQISPSILSADFSQLGTEIKRLEDSGENESAQGSLSWRSFPKTTQTS